METTSTNTSFSEIVVNQKKTIKEVAEEFIEKHRKAFERLAK